MAALSYAFRQRLRSLPGVLETQMRLRGAKSARQLATADSRICIEGFPRSGNSFSLSCALEIPGLAREAIADHTHSSANVRRAVRLGIPTFVLIRDPLEACLSLRVLGDIDSIEDGLQAWTGFYRRIAPILSQVVLTPLDRLSADPYQFVETAARAIGLAPPEPRPDFAAYMLERRRQADAAWNQPSHRGSAPDLRREKAKAEIADQGLSAAALGKLEAARALHAALLKSAPRVLGAPQTSPGSRA